MPKQTKTQLSLDLTTGEVRKPFVALHPSFNLDKNAKVFAITGVGDPKIVNLAKHTCDCVAGASHEWHHKRGEWVPNKYCIHKLKVMSTIIRSGGDSKIDDDMVFAYSKALLTRYNIFEVTSAFHKELRRRNVSDAIFWGSVYAAGRGLHGAVRYMLNILFEETRDHWLGMRLLQTYVKDKITISEVHKLITLFCTSAKKWELPHRLPIFLAEMDGYASLVKSFGRDVAKGSNIIPSENYSSLVADIAKGVKTDDPGLVQRGLKGLQKLKHGDAGNGLALLRGKIFSEVLQAYKLSPEARKIAEYIAARAAADLPVGYHELNALADCIFHDEPYDAGVMPELRRKMYTNMPKSPTLFLGRVIQIPIYAHDNHTWRGLSMMKRFTSELDPGAIQKHLDFRYCGAYYGVAWRYLAYNQFETITCDFGDVKWVPKNLHPRVMDLFY